MLAVKSSIDVASGSSSDVVIHRPAAVGGDPVVHSYATPVKPIGPGKARVLLAHTATVAPADVRVDGQVAFTNIANGEFAEADVPAGAHKVELLPDGPDQEPDPRTAGRRPQSRARSPWSTPSEVRKTSR